MMILAVFASSKEIAMLFARADSSTSLYEQYMPSSHPPFSTGIGAECRRTLFVQHLMRDQIASIRFFAKGGTDS
jgi:hypothetical protein